MKIGMFTDSYHPAMDGVVKNIDTYMKELRRLGHEVTVFAPSTGWGDRSEPGVYYLGSIRLRRYPSYRLAIYPSKFDRFVRDLELDLIHSHGFAAMGVRGKILARKRDIPYIFTFHTMVPQVFRHYFIEGFDTRVFEWLFWRYMRRFLRHNDLTIYPSRWAHDTVVESIGIDPGRYAILPTGVDVEKYRPDPSIRDPGEPTILHVGRVSREKNIETAIDIFAGIREKMDARMVIVGEGPALGYYRQYAGKKGLPVTFTGFVSEEKLIQWYQRSTILIMPSMFETQGIVPLEAMACGLPVLAYRHPAFLECWQDGEAGYFFTDVEEGVKKGVSLLEDRSSFSRKAKECAERFSIASLTRRLLNEYERVVNEHR